MLRGSTSILFALAVLRASPLFAADSEAGNPLTDRFSFSLGTFMVNTSTTLRVDGISQGGTTFDAESELGFDDSDRFRVDGYWRFGQRHKLRVMYFDTRRSSSKIIDEQIVYGDVVYPVNAQVDSRFSTTIAELAYEYAFLHRERYEVAASAGIHNLRFKLGLSTINSSTGQPTEVSRDASANGPMPVIGLRGVYRFNDKFYLDGQAQFFRIGIDPYKGRLEDYTISLVWMPFDHFGIGAGYNEFVTRIDVDSDRFDGHLRWKYSGARIFLTFSF